MRSGVFITVVGVTLASALAAMSAPGAARAGSVDAQAVRRALATHPLMTLDGKPVRLDGSVTVVNFWATWCKPCRHELPALDRLDREIAPDGGRVVAVSLDLERDNVRRFVKANHLGLQVCHDGPDGLAQILKLDEVPYTVVLDRKGAIAYTLAGTSDAQVEELSKVARRLAGEQRTALTEEGR
jgi:thiol-disulfide isomerase/thioredoxin